jgi:uncharacterized protein YlzI (FlbEa/FlbD family)
MNFIEVMGYIPGAVVKRRLFINVNHIKMVCPNKGSGEETLIYFGNNDFIVVDETANAVMEKINAIRKSSV